MMEIIQYSTSGFWVFIGTYAIILTVTHYLVNGILQVLVRLMRVLVVISRGWPPRHLDADGDLIKQ